MTERRRPSREKRSNELQLAAACNDFKAAVDRQASRITSYSRKRVAQRLGVTASRLTNRSTGIPSADEARERLRISKMVPVGTRLTGEGRSVVHYLSVYPVEPADDAYRLAIDEVAKPAGKTETETTRLYDVTVDGDRAWAVHDGQTLADEALAEPLGIVKQARELYL